MNIFSASFTFHKAGQGAFYGGFIKQRHGNTYYSMVYDCGTSPFITGHTKSLNDEISLFKSTLISLSDENKPRLDFLFISHLDYDHVSGIKRLLNEFNVRKIILPYIDPLIRRLLFSTYEEGGNENFLSRDEYESLLINPTEYFMSFNEQATIYVVKGEIGDNNSSTDGEIYELGSTGKIEEIGEIRNVKVFNNNLELRISKKWDFISHVKEVDSEIIDLIRLEICKILGLSYDDDLSTSALRELFNVDENRKKLRECYKRYLKDINAHGLALLHGPKNFNTICVGDSECDCYWSCDDWEEIDNKSLYTLLLGDTSLNLNNNPVKFPKFLLEKLEYVHVVQIPHHGSSKNWDQQQYKLLKLGKSLNNSIELTSVCNYGVGNNYNHPSQDVIHEVDNKLVLNNQYTRYMTSYCFIEFKN